MNEATLDHYRQLAGGLVCRERVGFTFTLANGKEMKAVYDPLFKTFTMGGMTFPAKELAVWIKLVFGSLPVIIKTRDEN